MTVMQAIENVATAAKKYAPMLPTAIQAVEQMGTDVEQHKALATDLMDAIMLAEQVISGATGL